MRKDTQPDQARTQAIVDGEERAVLQLIAERDAAEDALSRAFKLVVGQPVEWSNLFGYPEALEAIEERVLTLSATQQPLEADVVDIAGVEGMLDGLSNLALDAFFELNAFDEEEGGYQKLATIAASLGPPVPEVEAALEELVKMDLADFSEDLLAIDRETDEEYPWGAGYARSEEGGRLMAIYSTLQYHENAFSLRHRLSSQGGVGNA